MWLSPPGRVVRRVLLLIALLSPLPAAAQEPGEFDEGLFELVVPRLPRLTRPVLVNARGEVLLPLAPILELTGSVVVADDPGARLVVQRAEGGDRAVLDLSRRELLADSVLSLGADDLVLREGEPFLAAPLVEVLLGGRVQVDWSRLSVTLERTPPFPAQLRMEREARRAAARPFHGVPPALGPTVGFTPRSGGGLLEWSVSTALDGGGAAPTLGTRFGVGIAGGALSVGGRVAPERGTGATGDLAASYHRAFPGGTFLRQLRVGDMLTEGLRARSIRGISLTNAPFRRDPTFASASISPDLPPGWEFEVYQSGRLLGFAPGGSAEEVEVPLEYGNTPIVVKMYGPAGEVVSAEHLYVVPTSMLSPGAWEYAASAGVCPYTGCRWAGQLDIRRGVTRELTLAAGVEHVQDTLGAQLRPYATAALAPGAGWTAELQALHGAFVRGALRKAGDGWITGSAAAGITYPHARVASFVPVRSPRWHADGAVRLRSGGEHPLAVTLQSRAEGPTGGGIDRYQVSAMLPLGRWYADAGYEASSSDGKSVFYLRPSFAVPEWLTPGVRSLTLSGMAGISGGGIAQWELSATAQPGVRTAVTLSARQQDGGRPPALLLGVSTTAGLGRFQSRVAAVGGRTTGLVSADGGVALGGGKATALPYGGIGMAGVVGRVFRDLDGDGRWSEGDEGVADASVGVGGTRITTDAAGRYTSWSVLPFEALRVALDTASLADPAWIASRAAEVIRPSPHLANQVDFALVQTRELVGSLTAPPAVPTPAGVTVELVERATGEVLVVRTFSDGQFYIGRVLPGEYTVRVAESSLRALRARTAGDLPTVVVAADGGEPIVEVPPIHLLPAW